MLTFHHTEKDSLEVFKPYFAVQNTHIGDYSLAYQFMWHKFLAPDYALYGNCLILRELHAGKYYFYYPISLFCDEKEEDGAIEEIERYCRDNDIRLHFTNVPRRALGKLAVRYGADVETTNIRRWRDYLYEADRFRYYAGGRFSGQRNHVHQFVRAYPDWEFRPMRKEDGDALVAFLREYSAAQLSKGEYLADAELCEVFEIVPRAEELGLLCGLLLVGGKIVGFSAGERCGDMIVVHIEKALREYEGAYPMLAQQFALAFCGEGIRFLNRMDDAGDAGLRKSKLQYGPCELVDKYNVTPHRAVDRVSRLPRIATERLVLARVRDADVAAYARLASDPERNRYWGYDWREDCEGIPEEGYFLQSARDDFKHKREMPLGIYRGGALVGEVVLHRFGYGSEAEIGVRLLPEAEGKGYAREAVRAYAEYAFLKLGLETVEAKCYKENVRSRATLLGAGMREAGADETFEYFRKTAGS